jgi:glycine/D-amino acid oxidase-like deaminating enzyme
MPGLAGPPALGHPALGHPALGHPALDHPAWTTGAAPCYWYIVTIDPVTSGGTVPSRAQVVIVGGGVTGCSIAYHLAHLGWTDVVLLEQHQLTAGTTWHAAGLITSAGMTDETALFFSRYSRDLYARLEAETGHSTGFRAVGVQTRGRRVSAVLTDAGPVETETVVNAAGMWARQFGALAGVAVPLQAAEHYYLLTDTVPGMDADLPVIEDPDNYGYYRPEGDGMLVGLFEPVAAPWSLDGVPRGFSFGKLPPDWERMEPFLGPALNRIPSLAETGVRTFFCGPESFTAGSGPSARSSSWGCCSATRSGRPGSRRPRGTCAGRCCTTGWPRRAPTSASRPAGSSPSGSPGLAPPTPPAERP